jgi:hypothetical protein
MLVARAKREVCRSNLETWKPSQDLLIDRGKPRKTCVEVAGRRTFRILASSQQSGICVFLNYTTWPLNCVTFTKVN